MPTNESSLFTSPYRACSLAAVVERRVPLLVVDAHPGGELGRRLAGDRRERRLRWQPVCPAQVVVERHAVVATALDVDGSEVDDAVEALRQ
jgi:hypothetical protein